MHSLQVREAHHLFSYLISMNILENLVSKNIISKGDSIKIEKQANSSGKSIEEVLEEVGVPAQTILDVKGEYYNVPSMNLFLC